MSESSQQNRTTSTPKKIKEENLTKEADTEQSSTVLKSLLGVSPVMPAKEKADSDSAEAASSSKIFENNDSGFVSMTKSPNKGCASSQPSSIRGILRSTNPGSNSSMTLQQVIQRIAGGKPSEMTESASRVTRSRSFSLSDVSEMRSPKSGSITINKMGKTRGVEEKGKVELAGGREGSPESEGDGGYGTSGGASGHSTSPDFNLAQLVRAMASGNTTNSSSSRAKLPSISELDPAVSQAVKSYPGEMMPGYHSGHSPNILNSLFSYGPAQPSQLTVGQVGAASLLSDRQQINSMFLVSPGDPTSLDRAAKLYRNAASLYDATCTWSGQLPPRQHHNPLYSCKVFLGGVPWDITEKCLVNAFKPFGTIRIEWPGKGSSPSPPKGYLYVIFDNENAVNALLSQCTHDYNSSGGSWYYRISRSVLAINNWYFGSNFHPLQPEDEEQGGSDHPLGVG